MAYRNYQWNLFSKTTSTTSTTDFLKIEARGLATLAETKTIKTPTVLTAGNLNETAYLLMEYLSPITPNKKGWENLALHLAALHQTTQENFGLDHNNFIGSLPQQNHYHNTWAEFYVTERLKPQVKMAADRRLLNTNDLKMFEKLYKEIPAICPEEVPALIHGDLWNGNFLITKNQVPVLIDPAVCYGHREMDLAMTHLFGGFDDVFYNTYNDFFSIESGFLDRMEIYQLYYLLVHLNLFGRAYVGKVRNVAKQYL